METTLDEENSTASIETTHFSKYMVVDGYQWYKVWSKEFDYNPTGDLNHKAATLSAIPYNSNCNGGVKYGIMPEKHIDTLADWAGDMQSLIDDCFSYAQENQAKTIVDYFTEYLVDNDRRCGIDDLNSDAEEEH